MSKFHIIQTDPLSRREQILDFWSKYLPETPPARFEWLTRGNPAGPAIWLFAIEDGTEELAGMLSILPKTMIQKGRSMRAGILGDFMVDGKYRVFGPNLLLLKTALASMSDLGFELLFTLPNAQSLHLIKRAGANDIGRFKNLVKPLDARHYMDRYVGAFLKRLLAPFACAALRLISKETYLSPKGILEETHEIDVSFDLLWDKIRDKMTLTGDRSAAYLRWKYLSNPQSQYRILTLRDDIGGHLQGFVVFTVEHGKLHLHDMAAMNENAMDNLLLKAINTGRAEHCVSVNIEIFQSNPLMSFLKKFGFFDAKKDFVVFACSEKPWPNSGCHIFSGDRNI
jgi:hypothetical protein